MERNVITESDIRAVLGDMTRTDGCLAPGAFPIGRQLSALTDTVRLFLRSLFERTL